MSAPDTVFPRIMPTILRKPREKRETAHGYCVPKKEIIGLSRKRSNDSSAAQRARSAALAT